MSFPKIWDSNKLGKPDLVHQKFKSQAQKTEPVSRFPLWLAIKLNGYLFHNLSQPCQPSTCSGGWLGTMPVSHTCRISQRGRADVPAPKHAFHNDNRGRQ